MSLLNQGYPQAVVSPVVQSVAAAMVSRITGSGGEALDYQLSLNFVQPSYSVTRTSVGGPALRLNFLSQKQYVLSLMPVSGDYRLSRTGSDGFYEVKN